MKSLILKDLISFRSYLKTLLIFIAFFAIVTFSMDNVSFMSGMIILWLSMLPVTSLSYDQHSKWDLYSQALPVSRRQIIMAKYVLGLLIISVASVIAIILNVIVSLMKSVEIEWIQLIAANIAIGLVALVFLSILFPLVYKYGVEKSRMFMLIIIAIPSVLFMAIPNLNTKLQFLDAVTPELVFAVAAMIVLFIMVASYKVSLKIYTAKDF